MGLGGKVDDGARLMLSQQALDQGGISNVALHKNMARITLQGRQILQVTGIGQLVEVDHGFIRMRQPVEHKIGADEARAATPCAL